MELISYLCVTPAAVKTCYSIVALDSFPALGALASSVSLNLQISELKERKLGEITNPVMDHLLIYFQRLDIGADTGGWSSLHAAFMDGIFTHCNHIL